METAYHFILRQADDIASQLDNKPFIEEFYKRFKNEDAASLCSILYKGPIELIQVKLYHIVLKYSVEGSTSFYTKYIAGYITWFRNEGPVSFNTDVFNEISFLFLLGFRVSINNEEDLDCFKGFIESAILMIDIGADSTHYKAIILSKIRILIWKLIINPIAEGRCDKNRIIDALYCLSLAQSREIIDEKIIKFAIFQVLRYIKIKFHYYNRTSIQIDTNQEAQEINYYLGNIRIKSKSLKSELNKVQNRYGVMSFPAKIEEENKYKMNSNLILTRDRLKSSGVIQSLKKKDPFYDLKVKKYEFIYEKLIIAAKVYRIYDNFYEDKINKEVEYYQKLSSLVSGENCFLTYYGTIYKDRKFYLCMEYHKESLEKKIENLSKSNSKFSSKQIELFVHQMILSFEHMERLSLYHRDIKPSIQTNQLLLNKI